MPSIAFWLLHAVDIYSTYLSSILASLIGRFYIVKDALPTGDFYCDLVQIPVAEHLS